MPALSKARKVEARLRIRECGVGVDQARVSSRGDPEDNTSNGDEDIN